MLIGKLRERGGESAKKVEGGGKFCGSGPTTPDLARAKAREKGESRSRREAKREGGRIKRTITRASKGERATLPGKESASEIFSERGEQYYTKGKIIREEHALYEKNSSRKDILCDGEVKKPCLEASITNEMLQTGSVTAEERGTTQNRSSRKNTRTKRACCSSMAPLKTPAENKTRKGV